ncbi:hypothetical protein [Effusibacillus dendaii]|uniref:Uncharacterized protein n=1 Tax=Effusibacillus dendaii TaxID=2743772 RepID=A0A7I8D8I0_9BACL|nr:hypothetical protein [Effusibacillus dendaii]BCJ85116.1 hypothetical protein skT53_01010 [Effusibacillus dendaii]
MLKFYLHGLSVYQERRLRLLLDTLVNAKIIPEILMAFTFLLLTDYVVGDQAATASVR